MTRGDRLKKARENLGFNQSEASRLSGVLQKEISLLESDKREAIPQKYIEWLLKKGVDLNSIYANEQYRKKSSQVPTVSEPETKYQLKSGLSNTTSIPIVDIKAAAGTGYLNTELNSDFRAISFPLPMISKSKGEHLCINIKGDSMSPTLQDGGYVVIRMLEKSEWAKMVSDRVYVVVDNEGQTFLKRVRNRLEKGFIVMTSDNPDKATYPNRNLQADEIVSLWYVEWYLSAKIPNIHDQFYSKVQRIENELQDLGHKFEQLETKLFKK